jgi:signal transduction histidine kinase
VASLTVIRGVDEGKQFVLNVAVMSIGRDSSNLIRLHDTEISRRHAELRKVRDGYVLVDLDSSNGTSINLRAIREAPLRSGDHIQIGKSVLVYHGGSAAEPSSNASSSVSMIARDDLIAPSAILSRVEEREGSQMFLRSGDSSTGEWLKTNLASLNIMYQVTQATSHILDEEPLLEKLMDLCFDALQTDRGCIMLRDTKTSEMEPKAVRWRAGIDRQEKIHISRTIADYVLKEQHGVLVTDASQDERFAPAQSVVHMGIREAICVPMKGRHETIGVLYFDSRVASAERTAMQNTPTKLTEDQLRLAVAIAHQVALAIEETRYYHAMVQAERLAAVGQTIAALSHHIKNILQGLRSGTDLLEMGIRDKNEHLTHQGWKIVGKNQQRIYDLVMDMLSYSKDREPTLLPGRIPEVIEEVVDLIQARVLEKNVNLVVKLDKKLPIVRVDPEGLHRAILNLATNALDALEERPNPSLEIVAVLQPDGKNYEIHVIDNGCGIPGDRLPDMFKPFMSTKGSRGTGLGLPVSRKVIREMGGEISLESTEHKGTHFTIVLPVQPAHSLEVTGTLPPFDQE